MLDWLRDGGHPPLLAWLSSRKVVRTRGESTCRNSTRETMKGMSDYESNVAALRAIERATDALREEFAFFEEVGAENDRAFAASHRLARLEHRNALLRRLADELGGVDHHNTLTARGSMARLAMSAMCRMLDCYAPGYMTESLLWTGEGEKEVEKRINSIVGDIAQDGRDTMGAGYYHEANLSAMVRGHEVKNRTFLRNPNDWVMLCAQDVANIVDDNLDYFFEGEGGDEVSPVMFHNVDTSVFTPKVIRDAIICYFMGEATGPVYSRWYDFDQMSFDTWIFDPLDDLEHVSESEIASLVVTATEQCRKLLEAARSCAAFCTAFAALHKCLSPYECP